MSIASWQSLGIYAKLSVPTGSLLLQAVIEEKPCDDLSVSSSPVFKSTKFCVQAPSLSAVVKSRWSASSSDYR